MDLQKSNPPRRGKAGEYETQKITIPEQRSWTFTYEALTHVHSLRLFLFNCAIPVPWQCASLQATLTSKSPISSSPVVRCEFRVSSDGASHKLFVPVPVCLVDHSASLEAFSRSDHIEIKLKLLSSGGTFSDDLSLLGYTYRGETIEKDAGVRSNSPERDEQGLSLNSDTELLTSKQGVSFHCRQCSAKLTRQPISNFRALPSTEWRELADHWFGMCCCRDGVKTKSMMTLFEEFSTPTRGVCLVGSTTCIIHRNDVVGFTVDHKLKVPGNEEAQSSAVTENHDKTRPVDLQNDVEVGCTTTGHGCLALGTGSQVSAEEPKPVDDLGIPINGSYRGTVGESVEAATCCTGHGNAGCDDSHSDYKNGSKPLVNGFMNSFPSSELSPLNCYGCGSLVGVSCGGTEGLQLFKCHVSSDLTSGGASDVFRFHTLERVFSNELFCNAEEDSSYRYVVRDLSSRLPLLQLVLINHESWICSGLCAEDQSPLSDTKRSRSVSEDGDNTIHNQDAALETTLGNGELSPVFLEPVMKVMFCDTSCFNAEQLSEVENWGQNNQSDDIYMLGSEVEALSRFLQANRKLFPDSCAAFQQFHFSFLAR